MTLQDTSAIQRLCREAAGADDFEADEGAELRRLAPLALAEYELIGKLWPQRALNAEESLRASDSRIATLTAEHRKALEAYDAEVTGRREEVTRCHAELGSERAAHAQTKARLGTLADAQSAAELERDALRSHVADLARGGSVSTATLVHFLHKAEKEEALVEELIGAAGVEDDVDAGRDPVKAVRAVRDDAGRHLDEAIALRAKLERVEARIRAQIEGAAAEAKHEDSEGLSFQNLIDLVLQPLLEALRD